MVDKDENPDPEAPWSLFPARFLAPPWISGFRHSVRYSAIDFNMGAHMTHGGDLDLFDANRQVGERDRHDTYAYIRDSLLARHPDQEAIIRTLALAAARQLDGEGRRVVVRAPRPAPLGAILTSLAELTSSISYALDAHGLAETAWKGTDLPFHIEQLVRSAARAHGPDLALQTAERACIFVQRLDAVRLEGDYASASTRDHRHGQQMSLAPLFAGGTISADCYGGVSWSGRGALVVAELELSELPPGTPDVDDLVQWGMLRQLAEALAAASWIHVRPPTPTDTVAAVRRGTVPLVALFRRWGYELSVTDQVVAYVCRAVTEGPYSGGPAAALAWIEAACERMLLRLIDDGAPHGEPAVLAVDDLTLPSPPKGLWRE